MKNVTKFLIALGVLAIFTGCTANPVVYDNSRTGINDVRTYVIDGDDYRFRNSGIQDNEGY